MWLSKRIRMNPKTAEADLGVTSITGSSVGVVTRGEERSLPVFAPGGYCWIPGNGDTVLVIRGGTGGEERCVSGAQQKNALSGMLPGEVFIYSNGGASAYFRNDGTLVLNGAVSINGSLTINGLTCNVQTAAAATTE